MRVLATGDFAIVGILLIVLIGLAAVIVTLSYFVGPRRHGPIKDSTYESGVDPIGDTRRRFNVRFYLVAVMFLVFDVEIVFLYPWAVLFPRLRAAEGSVHAPWAEAMAQAGYGPGFFALGIAIFFALLTIGFVYEWRKGIFKWD